MTYKRLLLGVVLTIIGVACVDRITYVDRPVPFIEKDTVVVVRPETTFTRLPGRVDTVVTTRVDTLVITKHDTTVVQYHDTVTIVHYDTVRLSRVAAQICMYLQSANKDTLYLERKTAINGCAPQPMADYIIEKDHRDPANTLYVVLFDTLKMQLGVK